MTVFFDIETLDFFQDAHIKTLPRSLQLAHLRFGVAVVYDDTTDEWLEFWPNELPALWDNLTARGDLCGWNIRDFDLPVIWHNLARFHHYGDAELDELSNVIDLFADIRATTGRWYKLDVIAEANLGRRKIAHGQQAAEWLRSADPELMKKAAEYCRDDVQLVVDLWHKLQRGEPLLLPARPERNEHETLKWRR